MFRFADLSGTTVNCEISPLIVTVHRPRPRSTIKPRTEDKVLGNKLTLARPREGPRFLLV